MSLSVKDANHEISRGYYLSLFLVILLALAIMLIIMPPSVSSTGWSTPIALSPEGINVGAPEIAIDQAGHSHVVMGSANGVYYTVNRASGWTSSSVIPTETTSNGGARIAIDSEGHPHVVWSGLDSEDVYGIFYSTNPGTGWSSPVNLSPDSINNFNPRIALDSGDHPHVVWDNSDSRVFYSTNPGTGWITQIALSGYGSTLPEIAIDSAGHSHVVWRGSINNISCTYYASDITGEWSTPECISIIATNYSNNMGPKMALDSKDHPHVVWRGILTTTQYIYYTTNPGSGWTTPHSFSTSYSNDDQRWSGKTGQVLKW